VNQGAAGGERESRDLKKKKNTRNEEEEDTRVAVAVLVVLVVVVVVVNANAPMLPRPLLFLLPPVDAAVVSARNKAVVIEVLNLIVWISM
jgi:hypothetical protein